MTDTADPSLDAATICPEDGCHALLPATPEDRREHRAGHAHRRKVDEAIRAELGKQREAVAKAREEIADLRRTIADWDRREAPATGLRIETAPLDEDPADDGEPFDLQLDAPDPADEPYDPSDFPPQPSAAEEAAEDDEDAIDLPTFPASRF